eukprot:848467_1
MLRDDTCRWITVQTEEIGESGSNRWRYLAFYTQIYASYDVSKIVAYKLDYNQQADGSYADTLKFTVNDPNLRFLLGDYLNQNIPITIISSTEDEDAFPSNEAYLCKSCTYDDQYGDTCWAILPEPLGAGLRCGCNIHDGQWGGRGLYYGGCEVGRNSIEGCVNLEGGFTGYKTDSEPKGGISSVGLRLSIKLCDNVVDGYDDWVRSKIPEGDTSYSLTAVTYPECIHMRGFDNYRLVTNSISRNCNSLLMTMESLTDGTALNLRTEGHNKCLKEISSSDRAKFNTCDGGSKRMKWIIRNKQSDGDKYRFVFLLQNDDSDKYLCARSDTSNMDVITNSDATAECFWTFDYIREGYW